MHKKGFTPAIPQSLAQYPVLSGCLVIFRLPQIRIGIIRPFFSAAEGCTGCSARRLCPFYPLGVTGLPSTKVLA